MKAEDDGLLLYSRLPFPPDDDPGQVADSVRDGLVMAFDRYVSSLPVHALTEVVTGEREVRLMVRVQEIAPVVSEVIEE